jgi:hypothetical protein
MEIHVLIQMMNSGDAGGPYCEPITRQVQAVEIFYLLPRSGTFFTPYR